ncbi:polymorphic toxin-type HINT domain-containing protein [Plantactinospora sp. KBS50]|uniref:polymorphic toxin-type HINT domain-containing protein n=1 Tax=Plantactinospora sp. KBS50 TaxID=2024580 RepID=UPI000BAAEC60|nr:polymorphic toxin-type HINT domain-containing protein [Plantactinospora sp. KBS50]ASW53381.1 hypothetical protein CIK06_03035 [Plantactinospora sp. KBS50]
MNEPISGSDSISTSFGYDLLGNRTRMTDGRGNVFVATFNPWNLPESSIEPATAAYPNAADRTFTTSYDAAGRATSLHSPGGVSVAYSYDDLGRVTRQSGSGAEVATVDRVFGYDLAGRVTSAAGSAGTENFSYDDRGGLRSASGTSGNSAFSYNSDGEMASRTDAAGTTNYTYDQAGRLATVVNTGAAVRAHYDYNALSQVSRITYGTNGNARSYGYDALHRLTSDELKTAGGSSIAKIVYGYDANGNETSKTTSGFSGSAANTYTYDLADRLTSWDNGSTVTPYAYDKSGNRVQAGQRTFTYDQRNQLVSGLTAGVSTAYTYTARGTLATTGGVATRSDAFGEITAQYANATDSTTYTYDGLGRAIRPGFSYSGTGNTLAGDGNATYTRGPDDELLGVASGSAQTLAWTDQHDDVVAEFTDVAAAVAGSMTYDPLGKVLSSAGMLGGLGYQSEWTDVLTSRVNMLARWYDPDTGQFDTRDTVTNSPVPDSIEANRFEYGSANPLTNTDPTGHFSLGGAWKSLTSHASSTYHSAVSRVSSAVRSSYNEARALAHDTINSGRRFVAQKVQQVKHAYHQVKHAVAKKYNQAKQYVKHKVAQGRKFVSSQYHRAKQQVKKTYHRLKQAGRTVQANATRVVRQASHAVKDAYQTSKKFVQEHKTQIIEVAAIVGGIAAGLACTAATGGAGAVACIVGASALINLAKDAAEGNVQSLGDALGSLGTGAVQGAVSAVTGGLGGKAAGLVLGKLGGAAASLGGRMLAGAVGGGTSDAAAQMLTTGRVDWTGVALGAGIGAVTGGRRSCHSFDARTRVVMADGSSRPIAEVNVGDRVKATDPQTGRTAVKPVTMVHRNKDKDLVDVTVRTSTGVATLHTTAHHPFWDATARKWVEAAKLTAGHKLRTVAGAALAAVVAVAMLTGTQTMDDLTVADTHTYYVLAGTTPVLVHNCGKDQGIYEFPDMHNPGMTYVGKSINLTNRLDKHLRSGRLANMDDVKITHVCGCEDDVFVAEHLRIQQLRKQGVPLSNDINSPGKSILDRRNQPMLPGAEDWGQ